MSTTDTPLDLSRFRPVTRQHHHHSNEPEIGLAASGNTFYANVALASAIGNPQRIDVLISDDQTRAVIRPNPDGEFRIHRTNFSAGSLGRLLAKHGKRWRATIHPGPLALIQIDQPIERFADQEQP